MRGVLCPHANLSWLNISELSHFGFGKGTRFCELCCQLRDLCLKTLLFRGILQLSGKPWRCVNVEQEGGGGGNTTLVSRGCVCVQVCMCMCVHMHGRM